LKQIKIKIMKKMVIALAMLIMLASCGGSGETPTTDSLVAPIDSVVAPVDSANVVTDSAQLEDAVGAGQSAHEIPVK
jgi:ABC-type glycerol-3-phosphate transport system substrate-binding protein